MAVYVKNKMNLAEKAMLENAAAGAEQNALGIEDIMSALIELGELFAAQDDALVELAGIIEGGN